MFKKETNQERFNWMVAVYLLLITAILWIPHVKAADTIGTATAKGLMFKDSIKVLAFNDPDFPGITCYTTRYSRSLSFVDSTNSSLACRQTGPIDMTKPVKAVRKNVFTQKKGFIFSKDTIVDRFIDYKRKVVTYLSYTKSMGGKNSSHSLSVVAVKNTNPGL